MLTSPRSLQACQLAGIKVGFVITIAITIAIINVIIIIIIVIIIIIIIIVIIVVNALVSRTLIQDGILSSPPSSFCFHQKKIVVITIIQSRAF